VTPTAPFGTRLTVDAIAPMIDGARRPAPQPLGTWMSRWAAIYTPEATASAPETAVRVVSLPHRLEAA